MLGQTPRRVRLEHAVLEHVVVGICPIVGNLAPVVVAHDVLRLRIRAARVVWVDASNRFARSLRYEAVHLAAVDIGDRGLLTVRSSVVEIVGVVKRPYAFAAARIGHAHARHAAARRDAVRSRIRAEVRIEGAVFLHDDDDVLDLVDGVGARRRRRRRWRRSRCKRKLQRDGGRNRNQHEDAARHVLYDTRRSSRKREKGV